MMPLNSRGNTIFLRVELYYIGIQVYIQTSQELIERVAFGLILLPFSSADKGSRQI